jgi:hypothetical protein
MMDSDTGGVLKGEYGGNLHAYVVTAPFELVEADEVGEASGEAKPLGIRGKHVVIGEYKQATDNPQRLAIFFRSEWGAGGGWCRVAGALGHCSHA